MKNAGATTGKVSWLKTPCSSYMAVGISQVVFISASKEINAASCYKGIINVKCSLVQK